jgi:RND family efflux transporter MFP subunit
MKQILYVIAAIAAFTSCSSSDGRGNTKQGSGPAAPVYQLTTVTKTGISSNYTLPAQLAAYEEVSIFPKVNGYVKNVLVDIGSHVNAGQLLMTLDAPELLQASAQAKEQYTRSKADLSIAREHYTRLLEAAGTPGAVSPLDLSTARENVEADSAQSNAEKANWQMQETMLGYLHVTAPFSGVITERNVHPGALVSANAKDVPMLDLKQTEHLRLQVDIPEAFAAGLGSKDTITFYVNSLKGIKLTGNIMRTSGNINQQFRTERIEADVNNSKGLFAPGMYAEVIFPVRGSAQAFTVPKSAVVTSTERKYVLVIKNNTITKVDVASGNQNASSIEVFGALQAGDTVIVNANDGIAEGAVAKP